MQRGTRNSGACLKAQSPEGARQLVANYLHCASKKKHLDIFDCNLKNNYQMLIIFGTNISDTICHEMTVEFLTSPNVCFCTTWRKHPAKYHFFIQCDMIALLT